METYSSGGYFATRSLESYNQSLKIEKEIGDRAAEAKTIHSIGTIYQDANRIQEALQSYKQSLEIVREIGDKIGVMANVMAIEALKEKMQQKPHD